VRHTPDQIFYLAIFPVPSPARISPGRNPGRLTWTRIILAWAFDLGLQIYPRAAKLRHSRSLDPQQHTHPVVVCYVLPSRASHGLHLRRHLYSSAVMRIPTTKRHTSSQHSPAHTYPPPPPPLLPSTRDRFRRLAAVSFISATWPRCLLIAAHSLYTDRKSNPCMTPPPPTTFPQPAPHPRMRRLQPLFTPSLTPDPLQRLLHPLGPSS